MRKQGAGGKRPGAGRKKGSKSKKTIEQQLALGIMRERVLKKWDALIEAKMEMALGVFTIKYIPGKDGKKQRAKVYQKLPDSGSLEYLFSMVVGKPKENVDLKIKGIQELTDKISEILKK